jgi:hypothetical protein
MDFAYVFVIKGDVVVDSFCKIHTQSTLIPESCCCVFKNKKIIIKKNPPPVGW